MELKRNGLLYRLYFSDTKHSAFPSCRQITDSTNNKKNFNFYGNIMCSREYMRTQQKAC